MPVLFLSQLPLGAHISFSYSFSLVCNSLWQVYGLDINPRAVKIAWINLYLNALDENGQPIYDPEGKSLLDRVEFHESDLLAYCRDNKIELERIVGCIPQVLSFIRQVIVNLTITIITRLVFKYEIVIHHFYFFFFVDSKPEPRGYVQDHH